MEEKKLELFINYLVSFGFLSGISVKDFTIKYNTQNTNNGLSQLTNNTYLNEIYFRDKITNCLTEYITSLTSERVKLLAVNIFSKFKESKQMKLLSKLSSLVSIYEKGKMLKAFFLYRRMCSSTISSMYMNSSKKMSRNQSFKKNGLATQRNHSNISSSYQNHKNNVIYRNNSVQNVSTNTNRKILETSQYLKEQEELAHCTFHPVINHQKKTNSQSIDVHERLYTEHKKMQERKNIRALEREHFISKDNTFKPQLVSTSPKSMHYDFSERLKSFNERKNENIERIKSEMESDYKDNCSFSPNISISQKVSRMRTKSKRNKSGGNSSNKSLSNSFCANDNMPAYERLYKYNVVQRQNYLIKQKEIDNEIKLQASPSLRNVINSNSLGNKKEPSNQKVTVDYKKIEDLYNDYKRERDKRNKKRNQIDAELGITFKPELYTNGKYYNKINPNFHDRERQFIEDKEKFVNGYNMLMDQYLEKQRLGSGKYTNREKQEIANNIIQRLYKKGLEKYSARNNHNVVFQRVPVEDESNKETINNGGNSHKRNINDRENSHTYSASQLPLPYDSNK